MAGKVKRIKQKARQTEGKEHNCRNTATYINNDNKMNALHSPIKTDVLIVKNQITQDLAISYLQETYLKQRN